MDSTLRHESVANLRDITTQTPVSERPKPAVSDLLDRIAILAFVAVAMIYLASAIYSLVC